MGFLSAKAGKASSISAQIVYLMRVTLTRRVFAAAESRCQNGRMTLSRRDLHLLLPALAAGAAAQTGRPDARPA